ncbi:MAG: hypothetical protein CVV49_05840 [Spirochaetae bacterium HGW-Spirochaetae-5]|nr:MAG: hypothetical protein CVV49_05840 [Spirochaetae bacterium HGW-Spirochaetae-5]
MKPDIIQNISTPLKKLLILFIAVLICGSVSHGISQFNYKYEIIKQHSEETLLNLSRQDNIQLITKIILSFYNNNTHLNPEIKYTTGLTLKEQFIICLNRINKYPRWSKSTCS